MDVIFIRHGQTAGNAAGRWVGGGTDEPLCPAGEAAARLVKPDVAPKRIYVSPMLRARQTAAILFPGVEQIPVEGLREMRFGRFENKTAAELSDDPAYRRFIDSNLQTDCPGGESMKEFSVRVCAALAALLRETDARGEEQVVILAHGGVIMTLFYVLAAEKRPFTSDWFLKNCQGWRTEVTLDAESGRPLFTNPRPYLQDGEKAWKDADYAPAEQSKEEGSEP